MRRTARPQSRAVRRIGMTSLTKRHRACPTRTWWKRL